MVVGQIPGERLVEEMDRLDFASRFGTPEATAAYIEQTPFEVADRQMLWLRRLACGQTVHDEVVQPGKLALVIDSPNSETRAAGGIFSTDIMYVPPNYHTATDLMGNLYKASRDVDDPQAAGVMLQLGAMLTQRYYNGNSRTGAMARVLRGEGYDASHASKAKFALLAEGRVGIERAGLGINYDRLNMRFARGFQTNIAERQGYGGPLPVDMTPYRLRDIAETLPNTHPLKIFWVSRMIAQPYFGVTLATTIALQKGRLGSYLLKDANGNAQIQSELFFKELSEDEVSFLPLYHNKHKEKLLNEVADAFTGTSELLGDRDFVMQTLLHARIAKTRE